MNSIRQKVIISFTWSFWIIIDFKRHQSPTQVNVFKVFSFVVAAVLRLRLNFSTAWSTNAVSICQSAGLNNVTRVELSRRFLIKVCARTHTHTMIFPLQSFRIDFMFMFVLPLRSVPVPYSQRMERAWGSSMVIQRSWLSVCMTAWQNASINIPSPPSLWRSNHSRCLRWISWGRVVQPWRRRTTNWVRLCKAAPFSLSLVTQSLIILNVLQPPSLFFHASFQSLSSLWVHCVCCWR